MSRPVVVRRGRILCYRVYDVGNEIALDDAERAATALAGRRAALTRDGAHALVFATPPLDVELGARKLALSADAEPNDVTVCARLFDYGAVSIEVDVPIAPGTDLATLLPVCDELYESPRVDALARTELDAIVIKLGKALRGGHGWRSAETYTVIFLEELDGSMRAAELLEWPLLAKLLVGERDEMRPLSAGQTRDVLKFSHSYFEDDLVVIDWNSALVLEPSGSRDIPDILELATSQLLELRYYDGIYDRELGRVYDDLAVARGRASPFHGRYTKLARDVLRRLVEMVELTERVDNALKIIGDFYLGRVYESAVQRFRIRDWQASTDKKESLLTQAHALIRSESDARRSTLLELVVILLIFLELTLALVRR
jgi:hypothetical protein